MKRNWNKHVTKFNSLVVSQRHTQTTTSCQCHKDDPGFYPYFITSVTKTILVPVSQRRSWFLPLPHHQCHKDDPGTSVTKTILVLPLPNQQSHKDDPGTSVTKTILDFTPASPPVSQRRSWYQCHKDEPGFYPCLITSVTKTILVPV